MKFKKLYVYGDSFVHGHCVPQNASWPNLLAKDLKCKIYNRGVEGGSNKLSIINLLNDLESFKKLDDLIVIFAWTTIHRTCVYVNEANSWYNLSIHYKNSNKFYQELESSYFKYHHSDIGALHELYYQQIFIQSFLKQLNIKYWYVNSFISDEDKNSKIYEKHTKFSKFLDKERFLLGNMNSIRDEICIKRKLLGSDNFHPSEEGHRLISNFIKKEMEVSL